MAFTSDDAVFCVLQSCVDGLRSDRLVYYLYAYQKAGLDLKYRYRVKTRGIDSRQVRMDLNSLIMRGHIECNNCVLSLTPQGYLYYDSVLLTASEWDKVVGVKNLLDSLSEEELFFVCITDLMVHDVIKRSGVDGLANGRDAIECAIRNLSSEYSDDNFDAALGIMRRIGEGAFVWETINV